MKTRNLLFSFVVIAIVAIFYLLLGQQESSSFTNQAANYSSSAEAASVAAQSSTPSNVSTNDQASVALQEPEQSGDREIKNNNRDKTSETQTDKYVQNRTTENTPLITKNKGIVIRPNKYTKLITLNSGDKGLKIDAEALGLPKLNNKLKYGNCPLALGLPLSDFKRRAEAGDHCAYSDYAALASMELDRLYQDKPLDREKWKEQMKPLMDYELQSVVDGNFIAAINLGCAYAYPPFEDKTEGLAWSMIAVAMDDIAGYLKDYDCSSAFLGEPPQTYEDAIERAKFYIDFYGLAIKQEP